LRVVSSTGFDGRTLSAPALLGGELQHALGDALVPLTDGEQGMREPAGALRAEHLDGQPRISNQLSGAELEKISAMLVAKHLVPLREHAAEDLVEIVVVGAHGRKSCFTASVP